MEQNEATAPGRRIRYRLTHPLGEKDLEWARKQAKKAHLSLTTWLRRVGETQRARAQRKTGNPPPPPTR